MIKYKIIEMLPYFIIGSLFATLITYWLLS
jgi:hypothetical protein